LFSMAWGNDGLFADGMFADWIAIA
jgi:hypothetical protein